MNAAMCGSVGIAYSPHAGILNNFVLSLRPTVRECVLLRINKTWDLNLSHVSLALGTSIEDDITRCCGKPLESSMRHRKKTRKNKRWFTLLFCLIKSCWRRVLIKKGVSHAAKLEMTKCLLNNVNKTFDQFHPCVPEMDPIKKRLESLNNVHSRCITDVLQQGIHKVSRA